MGNYFISKIRKDEGGTFAVVSDCKTLKWFKVTVPEILSMMLLGDTFINIKGVYNLKSGVFPKLIYIGDIGNPVLPDTIAIYYDLIDIRNIKYSTEDFTIIGIDGTLYIWFKGYSYEIQCSRLNTVPLIEENKITVVTEDMNEFVLCDGKSENGMKVLKETQYEFKKRILFCMRG